MTSPSPAFQYPDPAALHYAEAQPFPHVVLRNAWRDALVAECKSQIGEFDDWDGEKDFYGSRKKHHCGDIARLPDAVKRVIREASEPAFLRWLEALTGERCLVPDPYLEGGGIHQIHAGGFLKVHADFNWNRRLGLYRRLNVLIYLNPDWQPAWGGALELWKTDMSACAASVLPEAGTMVVFTTDDKSFHGHPHELQCPPGVHRDSIALYYYSSVKPATNHAVKRNSTDYRPIEGDTFKSPGESLSRRLKRKVRRVLGR